MGKSDENETVITICQGDMREGFFRFGTSWRPDFERLMRRIEDDHLGLRTSKSRDGNITWWDVKVPAKYLSAANFGIRTRSGVEMVRPVPNFARAASGAQRTALKTEPADAA